MEKTMGLTTGQAYWYIQHFLKAGMIKKLERTYNINKNGKRQALYKVVTLQ